MAFHDNSRQAREIRDGFTLVELLTCVAIIGLLASLLLPGLARAKKAALRSTCLSQLRQQGIAWQIYTDENQSRYPDRRDLKTSLPGGYKPWDLWPKSDPRSGWAVLVLGQADGMRNIWRCPSASQGVFAKAVQVHQSVNIQSNAPASNYWMWRFDRPDDPVALDNFWGKTPDDAVNSLRQADNPMLGTINGLADVELAVDVYFPNTVPGLPEELIGRGAHRGGRNRLMLDLHAAFYKDSRTARD